MSLILAIHKSPEEVLLMADSCHSDGDNQVIFPHDPKIAVLPQGWLLGMTGNANADLLLLHGLDYERIEDPLYHRERFKTLKDRDEDVQGNYYLARGGKVYCLNGAGRFWEVAKPFATMGVGSSVALYLLKKGWPTGDLLGLGYRVIKECVEHFDSLRLPMVWASSVGGEVHTYEAED